MIKQFIIWVLKGMALGTANVIPGVSGGTIALITGIFERLIDAIKSFNLKALKLLLTGKFKEFAAKTDLVFLSAVFGGIFIAIVSIAKIFKYLFEHYPIYIWAFFFGLIIASVWYVGKTVSKWNYASIISAIVGAAIAVFITFLTPANENNSFIYLIICGVVAICSMILPGLSGSFVLIIMGNYKLVFIDSVNNWDFDVLLPVGIGAVGGLLAFSHLLSWVFKKFRDQTISLLTGFIAGSLGILWPWKKVITESFGEKEKTIGYIWQMPEINMELLISVVLIGLGFLTIALMERQGAKK